MGKILIKLKTFIHNLNILTFFLKNKFEHVFFVESKFYEKYFIDLIKKFEENNIEIILIHSDQESEIHFSNVKKFYLPQNFLRTLIFRIIKCKNFYITLIDLGNHELKKSELVENYIYIFHAPISVHRSYTETAFDNYDEIFCIGPKHEEELKKIEDLRNLKKKKITRVGYFFLDYLRSNKANVSTDAILIAPSWNYSIKNFVNNYLIQLIENLILQTDNDIIFRPHPEHLKRDVEIINLIKKKFTNNKRFFLDFDKDNLNSLLKSKIIFTDNSGIGIEFILGLKKPVIYFDKYLKIHNSNYKMIDENCIEDIVKNNFGYILKNPEFDKLDHYINDALSKFDLHLNSIDRFSSKYFYNLDKSVEFSFKEILKKIDN